MPAETRDSRWFAARLPRPEVLKSVLRGDPVGHLVNVARDRAIVEGGVVAIKKTGEQQVAAILDLATNAAARLSADPDAPLGDDEKNALDLFLILVARPSIFVRGGKVSGTPENWPEVKHEEELLPDVIAGVGRIELANHFKTGTGFIVGDKRILTNNHVVCGLVGLGTTPMAWKTWRTHFDAAVEAHNKTWAEDADARPWFEMRGEFGSSATSTARIAKILGCHTDVDMAVLELDSEPQNAQRVTLATKEPAKFEGLHVYVVGYPVEDTGKQTPIPILRRVFGEDDSLGTKRFAPGTVVRWETDVQFNHDASTLPGSSGSCVVDFNGHRVVGLHHSGTYNTKNNAVPLWKFQKDVLLTKNGVVFD